MLIMILFNNLIIKNKTNEKYEKYVIVHVQFELFIDLCKALNYLKVKKSKLIIEN